MKVLVTGTVGIDTIITPWMREDNVLGGSAIYAALAAGRLRVPVALVAVVGNDFGDSYRQSLRSSGVDLSGVDVNPSGNTFAWGGRYEEDLNTRETLYTDLNVLHGWQPTVAAEHQDADVLCLANMDPDMQLCVLSQMKRPRAVICDTMNYWITHTPEALEAMLRKVDCLIINDSEARQLTGESNLAAAAALVRSMGPRTLVIKKGEHGAMLFAEEAIYALPGFPLDTVRDPTGAGDAFIGGFSGSLARERDIDLDALTRAVVYGSVLASFSVETIGPQRLLEITRDDIQRRAEAFGTLTRFPTLH